MRQSNGFLNFSEMGKYSLNYRIINAALFVAISVMLTAPTVKAQPVPQFVKFTDKSLTEVKTGLRGKLKDRLELYIQALNKSELGTIYELMPDACRHNLVKEDWLKQVVFDSAGQIQDFTVETVYQGGFTSPENLKGRRWIVKGCAKYLVGGKAVSYQLSIDAVQRKREWYFCGSGNSIGSSADYLLTCGESLLNNNRK